MPAAAQPSTLQVSQSLQTSPCSGSTPAALGERLAHSPGSLGAPLGRAAGQHARAALLSIHARVAGTGPSTWEDPSLVQLWGPQFSVFVVAARDLAVFSLGTLPDDAKGAAAGGGPCRPAGGSPRRRADALRRGGPRAGRAPEQPQVRGGHRHGPDPLGRRAAAGRLDRAATTDRSARRPPGARAPVPAHLRSGHARGLWLVGGDRPAARHRGVRGAPHVADAGAHRLATHGSLRKTRQPSGPRPGRRHPHGSFPAATPTSSSREPTATCWSPMLTAVARCGPRASRAWRPPSRRRDRRDLAARRHHADRAALAPAVAR